MVGTRARASRGRLTTRWSLASVDTAYDNAHVEWCRRYESVPHLRQHLSLLQRAATHLPVAIPLITQYRRSGNISQTPTKVPLPFGPKAEVRGWDVGQDTPKLLDSVGRNDSRRQVMEMKADALWCLFLERLQPTSLDGEFSSIEFELAFAVNIRSASLLVDATPACRRFADIAINTAVKYSCLRHSGERAAFSPMPTAQLTRHCGV